MIEPVVGGSCPTNKHSRRNIDNSLKNKKKLMHQRLSNNDVSVFYLNYFSNALSSIRMIVRSSRNYVNS